MRTTGSFALIPCLLFSLGGTKESPCETLLRASAAGDLAAVMAVLPSAEPCEDGGWSPIALAAYGGHTDVVEYLGTHGAELTRCYPGGSLLHLAAQIDNGDVVRVAVRLGLAPDCAAVDDRKPLHVAAETGSLSVVRELLRAGASTGIPTDAGLYPLHMASALGHTEVVRELLSAGADTAAVDRLGETALHYAAQNDRSEIAYELGRSESGEEARCLAGKSGWTPLHWAAALGSTATMEFTRSADSIQMSTADGWTALHVASALGRGDVALRLVELGASPEARDWRGRRPAELFDCWRRHFETILGGGEPNAAAEHPTIPSPASVQPPLFARFTKGSMPGDRGRVRMVVWPDGVVAFAARNGPSPFVGLLSGGEIESMEALLAGSGFFLLADVAYSAFCTDRGMMMGRQGGTTRTHSLGFDASVRGTAAVMPTAEYHRFLAMWRVMDAYLPSLNASDAQDLGPYLRAGRFRGVTFEQARSVQEAFSEGE